MSFFDQEEDAQLAAKLFDSHMSITLKIASDLYQAKVESIIGNNDREEHKALANECIDAAVVFVSEFSAWQDELALAELERTRVKDDE